MRSTASETGTPMATRQDPALLITEQDMERLRAVVERNLDGTLSAAAEQLELELDRASVVPQDRMPPNVVTMRSRIVFEDLVTGKRREAVLVYPEEADPAQGKISVLAPVGTALLGLSEGASIDWPMPGGKAARLKIVSVLYQPEAAGDLHL